MATTDRSALQLLREKIADYTRENQTSRPDLLRLIGIDRSDDNWDTYIKAVERFQAGSSNHLHPHLRAKLLDFFKDELPVDALDLSFYEDYIPLCEDFYEQAKRFYEIPSSRIESLKRHALGRFFIYKKPVNPHNQHLILRSYAKILIPPERNHNFAMVVEYQKCTYQSKDVGTQVDHDFYIGFATRKDGALILMTRQIENGAVKTSYFDTISMDYDSRLITRGYGINVETCDGHSPSIVATSNCAIQRIPDAMSLDRIEVLIDNVPREDVDEVIVSHLFNTTY